MSEQNPQYNHNPVASFFEHIGHDAHKVESFVVEDAIGTFRKAIALNADLKEQFPTLKEDTAAVLVDVFNLKGLGLAIALAASQEGANIGSDIAVIAAFNASIPTLIKLFADGGTLAGTLNKDIQTDVAVIT